QKELGKLQYLKTGLNMVAAGLSAPTDSVAGIAAATVSPAIAYEIGQHFKGLAKDNADGKLTAKQEAAHILSHAVLGAAVAAVGGNDAMTAAVAAGGAEAVAPVVSNWLYGEEDASKLTAEQKETVASIAGLAGTAVGVAMGDAADVAQGSQAAINAVENNYLLKQDWDNYKSKVNSCSQNQNAAACYREAQKELYVISRQRNKRLKSACAENGDIALCEKYVAEADLSRDLTKRELASYGTNNPAKPLPSFVEYYDIPWSDNPSIHYWSTKINLPISDKLNYGLNLAVNRVTGEIFLGVSGEPNIKSSGAKKLLGAPSVSIIAGHINNLSPIEKARLWETITNTLQGQSTTIAGCGYFSCVGANKTPSGKVSFEFGISTSGTTSGAVGKANMIKIGRIIGDD
ncbi:VENN motif pre-toxin domain-containing protein, partial [Neisseria animalis]